MKTVQEINEFIKLNKDNSEFKENDINDGHHSFADLYEFRKMYNAVLFNEWAKEYREQTSIEGNLSDNFTAKYDVHKSWKHHDGEDCFGGGWFIVVAVLPTGQISNHYKASDWNLFNIPVWEKAKHEFDGHTPEDVLTRLKDLATE